MDLTVIGAGYVGAVTAASLAERGHVVRVLESNPDRVESLARGVVPFREPGLSGLFADGIGSGRLSVTGDPERALSGVELVLICVGTPLADDGMADLGQLRQACSAVGRFGGSAEVVVRSTLPLGASAETAEWLGDVAGPGFASNPEFLSQGSAVADFARPTRVVIGTADGLESAASAALRRAYAGIEAPYLVTDYATAELIKNAANAFLAMKLSFVNEIADLSEAFGADIASVVQGIGLDPRIGSAYLRPGIGFGGSCLPKELANLLRLGRQQGLPMHTFGAAEQANDERPARIADRVESLVGPLGGRAVGFLGLAFKPNTDDVRHSPAVALAREMIGRGASVRAHDPWVSDAAVRDLAMERVRTASEAVDGVDVVVLATEWPEYADLDWPSLADRAKTPVLFDGRNALDPRSMRSAGWRWIGIGVASEPD